MAKFGVCIYCGCRTSRKLDEYTFLCEECEKDSLLTAKQER